MCRHPGYIHILCVRVAEWFHALDPMLKRAALLGKKRRAAANEAASSSPRGTSNEAASSLSSRGAAPDVAIPSEDAQPKPKRLKPVLNLKDSLLMRLCAKKVSRGAEASLFQEVAAATLAEAKQTGRSESVLTERNLDATYPCI